MLQILLCCGMIASIFTNGIFYMKGKNVKILRFLNDRIKPLTVSILIQAFFGTFALCNIGHLSVGNILPLLLFILFSIGLHYQKKIERRNELPKHFTAVTLGFGILFTVLYILAEHKNLTGTFENRLFRLGFLAATIVGLFVVFFKGSRILMVVLSRMKLRDTAVLLDWKKKMLIFLGLLLCWMPWFLYLYPAVMTPDSISQFSQAIGVKAYSNHHPVIHTLLIKICYQIGYGITQNVYAGIAFYTVVQMLMLSGIETVCLSLLTKRRCPKWLLAVWFLFWGLIPYNAIYAVTMWKDVLFSALVLLYVLILYLLLEAQQISVKSHGILLLFMGIAGFFVCLFRSNGLYVYIFMIPFVLITFRKNLKLMAPIQMLVLVLVLMIKGPVFEASGVTSPHLTESLSIPLQQVARVVTEGRELTQEQTALINNVVDISYIPEYYDHEISDPIKALVLYNNADYLQDHLHEFFRLWVEVGVAYPRDYLEAFIDQTKGYWYPEIAGLRTFEGISENELGLIWPKILRGMIPVKISEIILKLTDLIPMYGLLWSIGAFTWAMLFLAGFQFLYGEKKYLLLFVPFIGTILTLLLATPVSSDLRYAYPLFLGLPFWGSLIILERK